MSLLALTGARVFTGERFVESQAVLIEHSRIAGLCPQADLPSHARIQPLDGGILAPGFVDAQVNGGGGVLFNADPEPAAAARIAAAHAPFGTTALLPTLITDTPEIMRAAIIAVREAMAAGAPGVAGLHLEGPFLSIARKGAHDPALIRPMTQDDVDLILGCGIETILLTVAPENAPLPLIRQLADAGVIISLGHTDAPYETAMAAADSGASGVTHLFNAMSQLQHRAPGVVGAALDHGGLYGGLIADGFHVHPAALRTALAAKREPGKLFLVTDAMSTAGDPGDTFELNGRLVTRRGGKLTLEDGTLAGSDLTMDVAIRHTVDHLGQPVEEALRMASLYPAQFLRLDKSRGRIAPGFAADLVHLSASLHIRGVWIGGTPLASTQAR